MQLPNYKVIQKNNNSNHDHIEASMYLPSSLIYFDGHFDHWPVLPAVAQLFIIQQLLKKELLLIDLTINLKQTKFISPIFPDTTVRIIIDSYPKEHNILFQYFEKEKKKSFGTIKY